MGQLGIIIVYVIALCALMYFFAIKPQKKQQKEQQQLTVIDGWKYFIYGWTAVVSEVFHIPITGKTLDRCDEIASKFR